MAWRRASYFPRWSHYYNDRWSWPIKTGPVKVWSIGGGSQMLGLIIWLLIANIKFILMSPEEWKDRIGILEKPIRLAVLDRGSGWKSQPELKSQLCHLYAVTLSMTFNLSPVAASSVNRSEMIWGFSELMRTWVKYVEQYLTHCTL